ncbi:MAG: hypothetical protein QGG54_18130, partial [Gammaproteobacteria bacterium]|nr:hypothetical protein [Gammaproteobacteria bacterium]
AGRQCMQWCQKTEGGEAGRQCMQWCQKTEGGEADQWQQDAWDKEKDGWKTEWDQALRQACTRGEEAVARQDSRWRKGLGDSWLCDKATWLDPFC